MTTIAVLCHLPWNAPRGGQLREQAHGVKGVVANSAVALEVEEGGARHHRWGKLVVVRSQAFAPGVDSGFGLQREYLVVVFAQEVQFRSLALALPVVEVRPDGCQLLGDVVLDEGGLVLGEESVAARDKATGCG